MKKNIAIAGLFLSFLLSKTSNTTGQSMLWFGTVKMLNKMMQGRFEVLNRAKEIITEKMKLHQ